MFKKIYAIALIALSSTCFYTMAQKQIEPNKPLPYTLESKGELPNCKAQRAENVCTPPVPGCPVHNNMFKNIELTTEQQAQLKKLSEQEAKQSHKQREKAAKERAKRHKKHDKEIKKILTPAQYAQYTANLGNCQACRPHDKYHHKGHGKHHRKGPKHHTCDNVNSCPLNK